MTRRVRAAARLRTVPGALAATFVVLLGVYLLSPVVEYGDGRGAGPTAASIVTRGDLRLDPFSDLSWYGAYQTTVVDGHTYDFYPWTRSVFAVPVALGLQVGQAVGLTPDADAAVRSDRWERVLLVVPGSLATAGAAVLVGLLASRLVRDRRLATRTAVATALVIGLATGYWSTSSRSMWQHGPACFWFTLALLGADHLRQDGRARWAAVIGATATAAALTRPLFAILAVALLLWCLAVRPRRAVSLGLGVLAAAVPVTLVNLATFGSPLMPYYAVDRAGKA
ncbi:MAG TPA: hypothetical protein VK507_04505, partial [Iamia sp.]|nr:hypothetical protein [Iamia sp.]